MLQIFRRKTRWLAILAGLAQMSVFWACSATVPSSRKHVGPLHGPDSPAHIENSFPDLWEKWTVYLSEARRSGAPLMFGTPFGMGADGPGGGFPLQVAATLMDRTLIEAGVLHYSALIKMTPEEELEFRRAYYQEYEVEDHLLIWCELSTFWAELHLDLDRYTIFIEDDAINQYEPLQIREESRPSPQVDTGWPAEFGTRGRSPGWETHQKSLMLCFPNSDPLGNPVLSQRTKFFKLIFLLGEDDKTRAEGVWVFKK